MAKLFVFWGVAFQFGENLFGEFGQSVELFVDGLGAGDDLCEDEKENNSKRTAYGDKSDDPQNALDVLDHYLVPSTTFQVPCTRNLELRTTNIF